MAILVSKYETDIPWYDWGAANGSANFAAGLTKNQLKAVVLQLTIVVGSRRRRILTTPEYATFSSVSARKWESSQGVDPTLMGTIVPSI